MHDVLSLILDNLDWKDILAFRQTCKAFRKVVEEQSSIPFPSNRVHRIKRDTDPTAFESSFLKTHVLSNISLELNTTQVPESLVTELITCVSTLRPLHVYSYGGAFSTLSYAHRIERLSFGGPVVNADLVQRILSAGIPHLQFHRCRFSKSDWTAHQIQSLRIASCCELAYGSTLLPITPAPKLALSLDIFQLTGDITSGDWKFSVQDVLSADNRLFLTRVTGCLHLSGFSYSWAFRNQLHTLSCTTLCLQPLMYATFPLVAYPSVQALYAKDLEFRPIPEFMPAIRHLFLDNCCLARHNFVPVFPNLEVLEVSHDMLGVGSMFHVSSMQHLHTLVVRIRSVVFVSNNPMLTSIRVSATTILMQNENPSLQDIYYENAVGACTQIVSDTGVRLHHVPIVPLDKSHLAQALALHSFVPLS